jgi:hypothetical protein
MATKFAKNQEVKVSVVVPQGPVQKPCAWMRTVIFPTSFSGWTPMGQHSDAGLLKTN